MSNASRLHPCFNDTLCNFPPKHRPYGKPTVDQTTERREQQCSKKKSQNTVNYEHAALGITIIIIITV